MYYLTHQGNFNIIDKKKIPGSGGYAHLHLYIINWLFFPLKVISYLAAYFSQMFAQILNACTLGVSNLRSSA